MDEAKHYDVVVIGGGAAGLNGACPIEPGSTSPLFVAFQLARGWSFREDLSEAATLIARLELEPTTVGARGYP